MDVIALKEACILLARQVLLDRSEAATDRTRKLAADFQSIALDDVSSVLPADRNPDLVVRIIEFMAGSSSATPFEPYGQWFFGVLLMFVGLACPGKDLAMHSAKLYDEIEIGRARAGPQ